jgi:ribosomal protein L32
MLRVASRNKKICNLATQNNVMRATGTYPYTPERTPNMGTCPCCGEYKDLCGEITDQIRTFQVCSECEETHRLCFCSDEFVKNDELLCDYCKELTNPKPV